MAARRYISFIFVGLIALTALFIIGWFYSCQGRMQECYASFRAARDNVDLVTRDLQRTIYAGFAASDSTVAFPMPLGDGTSGILLMDRSNGKPSLIASTNYTHWSPNFSSDGERLVFARQFKESAERELVSCKISSWQCDVLYRSNSPISSAVDIGNEAVIFSMSMPKAGDNERMRRFDLYVAQRGQTPIRLTEYEAYTMSSISVGGNKIAFAAEGGPNVEKHRCEEAGRFRCDESNIYVLDLAHQTMVIINKPLMLKPSLVVPGYSVGVALSGDGTRVALKNTARRGNPWRYNVIMAGLDGTVDRELNVEGYAFSSGVFVGDTFLVNELFDDRYRVRAMSLSTNQRHDLQFEFSPGTPLELQPINLSFS